MDKFGVKQDDPAADKRAGASDSCPLCGQLLKIHGPTRLCPKHGSAPFETPETSEEPNRGG